jgi:hypothetical protein
MRRMYYAFKAVEVNCSGGGCFMFSQVKTKETDFWRSLSAR